uniref:RPA_interact_C domain-containing protein n=1 Tax=Anopheles atroparvus TaxID=41427 RepID=A0A182IRU5_ANOAO
MFRRLQKCRIRIKEARKDQVLRKRNIVQEERTFLEAIVREELSELEHDIALQDLIYKELMEDTEQWLFYEQSTNYLISSYETDTVFCPICERGELMLDDAVKVLQCSCGIRLRYDRPIETFSKLLSETIALHASRCTSNLQFFSEPIPDVDFVQLNAFCLCCDYYRGLTD